MFLPKRKKYWGENHYFKGINRTFSEHVITNRLCFSKKLNISVQKLAPRKTGTNQNIWQSLLLLL